MHKKIVAIISHKKLCKLVDLVKNFEICICSYYNFKSKNSYRIIRKIIRYDTGFTVYQVV